MSPTASDEQINNIVQGFNEGHRVKQTAQGFVATTNKEEGLALETLAVRIHDFIEKTDLQPYQFNSLHDAIAASKKRLEKKGNGVFFQLFAGKEAKDKLTKAKDQLEALDHEINKLREKQALSIENAARGGGALPPSSRKSKGA